jgi:hypothetical protein
MVSHRPAIDIGGNMTDVTMTIDGKEATTEFTFDVVNPATGAPEAVAPDCTVQQLDEGASRLAPGRGPPA